MESRMSDTENVQQFQTHMLAFFGHILNTVKTIVQAVPAAGIAGHLLQQAEASLAAVRVAIDPPPPLPEPATPEGKRALADKEAADKASEDLAAAAEAHRVALEKAEESRLLAEKAAATPQPEPTPETTPAPEAPATDVGVPPAANPISDYPNPDHSQT
jgi:hypothetical protein